MVELWTVRKHLAVGEARPTVRGIRVATQAAPGGHEEAGVLAVVVADGDPRARHRDRCFALGRLIDLVAVQRRVVHPHVREGGRRSWRLAARARAAVDALL